MGRHGVRIAQESRDLLSLDRVEARPSVKIRSGVKSIPSDGSPGPARLEDGPTAEGAVRQSHLKDLRQVASTNAVAVPSSATRHIQKTALGPPRVSAIATSAMFPVPAREAPELDQARPDAELQAGCLQNAPKEPSPKEGTHWIDEILKLFHKGLPTSVRSGGVAEDANQTEYFLAVEHGAAALIFKPALA